MMGAGVFGMGVDKTLRYCKRCRRPTVAYRSSVDGILVGAWHCGTCGKRHSSAGGTLLFLAIIVAVAAGIIYANPEYRRQFFELFHGWSK
jgi:hypothetical protein